jgi:hypothetical protein
MNIRKITKSISKYVLLHWNLYIPHPNINRQYYKSLKNDLKELKKQEENAVVKFPISKLYPCYQDKEDNAGSLPFHYFFQDLYVAQRIYQNNPVKHIDIGSRIDGFVAHVASYRQIDIYDIRPIKESIPNVQFKQCDLMNLGEEYSECTDSISCLHALEHFGLGRYGDPICYEGYLLGFMNIYKMLKKTGKFYFSVPMGKQRTEFHAHRVFSIKYLLEMITPYYEIDNFSYIDDNNTLHENVEISESDLSNNFECDFGCAIFELTKK